MAYHDSTGAASQPDGSGGSSGIYVIRSPDPSFQTAVQVLVGNGTHSYNGTDWNLTENGTFQSRTSSNATAYSYLYATSIDWMYSDVVGKMLLAINGEAGKMHIFVRNPPTSTVETRRNIFVFFLSGAWNDGPGLVRRPDGHARPLSDCSTIPVDIFRGIQTIPGNNESMELAWAGLDLTTGLSCADSHLDKSMEGYLMTSSGLPLTLVVSGKRLQFALSGPATKLSRNYISVTSSMFHLVPYGGSLYASTPVWYTDGQPHAFEIDGPQLWPVGCADVIYANNSPVYYLSPGQYGSMVKGPSLFCIY